MEREWLVNGLAVRASFREESVQEVFLPLLRRLSAQAQGASGRLVAFLAGPPGSGKSTLAAFLQELSGCMPGQKPLQALGMDGFHYPQREIEARQVWRDGRWQPMKRFKGGPESFDVEKLAAALGSLRRGEPLRWPLYDRRLHDVVEDALEVQEGIVLVEGNWLLDQRQPWASLRKLCDMAIALRADEELLRPRLIARKMLGGLTEAEARTFYETSDGPNVRMCLRHLQPADVELQLPL